MSKAPTLQQLRDIKKQHSEWQLGHKLPENKFYSWRNKMKIKVKKLNKDAVIPKYAKQGDAGMDLVAISKTETDLYIEYDTGLAFEIPENHVGFIFPRSSISKYHLDLANAVGVVDSGYRGSVTCRFKKTKDIAWANHYAVGDRIAQIIVLPYPEVKFEEVEELTETERGAGGYGSSGN